MRSRHSLSIGILAAAVLCAGVALGVRAAGQQEFRIPRRGSKEIWYGFNVKGKLYYAVRARSGKNEVRAYWRTWGLGNEAPAGTLVENGDVEIPISIWRGVISARLRVEATEDTVLLLREDGKVAQSLTFTWP